MKKLRRARFVAVIASVVVTAPLMVSGAASAAPRVDCAAPGAAQEFERRDAESLGIDGTLLAEALTFGERTGGLAIQVYRHGCLVDSRGIAQDVPLPMYSVTKGVTALAVGRAVTLGHVNVDDTLGKFFPHADDAHRGLTVRQVLNQTTGLEFSWGQDTEALRDQVEDTLNRPLIYAPGTTFQYAQSVLSLLPRIIEISTGRDFFEFVQSELFGPVGIERGNWNWLTDGAGTAVASGGLSLRATDLARLGQFMMEDGRDLISSSYMKQLRTPTDANGGYGFLTWLNGDGWYRGVEVPTSLYHNVPIFPGMPDDTFAFAGALGQFVFVIPSEGIMIVRLGVPTRINFGDPTATLTGASNPDNKEFFSRIGRSFS
ncbi:MAG: beta-lactamase family protein [Rhodococcus sp.]|nr:beta-lactamase family protein [Rhodococcus sp. (in: high G+C Gram-positive bacteria)]